MPIVDRTGFIQYCLRRLGHPVIQINVDATQVEDRIDEALRYYKQYHYDGTEREVIQVTLTAEMVASKAIRLPPNITSVLNIVPTMNSFEAGIHGSPYPRDSGGMVSLNQFLGASPQAGMDMKGYAAFSMQLDVMKMLFRADRALTFRRSNNTVTFDISVPMAEGEVYLMEVYRAVDENGNENLWEDIWLQEFGTCLIKLQWGSNLIKYSGVQLPTGITLDGQKIYDDAQQEREKLIERLRNEFEYPMDFFMY